MNIEESKLKLKNTKIVWLALPAFHFRIELFSKKKRFQKQNKAAMKWIKMQNKK